MVYYGPSRGCYMCRKRRIKCDEAWPACKRCIRSKRVCPGYRTKHDLMFRGENQAARPQATQTCAAAGLAPVHAVKNSGRPPASPVPQSCCLDTIRAAPRQPLEQQASCHFISHFALSTARPAGSRANLDYLVPLSNMNSTPLHFQYVFDACALAFFNNCVGTRNELNEKILRTYNKALSATLSALHDPQVAHQDATLATVLLLGLFEQIAPKCLSWHAWGSHVQGAIQLAKARGKQHLRTKLGLDLFYAVRIRMMIFNLFSPEQPATELGWCIDNTSGDDYTFECQRRTLVIGDLRGEANRLLTEPTVSPIHRDKVSALLEKCQAYDAAYASWVQELPDFYQPKTAAWVDSVPDSNYTKAHAHPGPVNAFQDITAAHQWNFMQSARLILGVTIIRLAARKYAPRDYRTTLEYLGTMQTCFDIVTDIVASIPYQLGWFSKRPDLLSGTGKSPTFTCGEDNASKGLGGYVSIIPLACILGHDCTTTSQRIWAQGRLQYIGFQLGINAASNLPESGVRMPSTLICRDAKFSSPDQGSAS